MARLEAPDRGPEWGSPPQGRSAQPPPRLRQRDMKPAMRRLKQSWTLGCDAERFWRVFLDAEYSRALYLDAFRFKSYRVLSSEATARNLHLAPRLNLPGPLAKLVGDSFAYEQHGTLDRPNSLWTWKMVQPGDVKGKAGLVSSSGTICVTDAGAGQCTRTDDVTVTAHLFGLGSLLEATVEKELRTSWDTEIAFLQRWLTEKSA